MVGDMKIAHISIVPAFSSGIFKKIEDKANIARQSGLDMDFYLLNPVKFYQSENLFIVKKSYDWLPTNFLKTVAFRLFKMHNLTKLIPLNDYDAIVLRYPLMDGFGYGYYAKKYGTKTFTEHHTDEISELFAVGRKVDKIRAYVERWRSGKFLSQLAGVIAVTDEVRQIELEKLTGTLPSLTLANGINTDSYPATGFVPFDGSILNMLFVASKFEPWHGLEMLLKKLNSYRGSVKIILHLVGALSEQQKEQVIALANNTVQVELHGNLYGNDLNEVMRKANIGISSLALSKNKMQEACPLKSREYIVRGLPFFYAYKDTDLKGDECFAKYVDEKGYRIEEIIAFSQKNTENAGLIQDEFKKYLKIISWENKLHKLEHFIRDNLNDESR